MISPLNSHGPSSNLDLSFLKMDAQRRLFYLLDKFEGTKTVIFDDKLIGPLEFVANASLLKKHDAIRLLRLSDAKITLTQSSTTTDFILFFLCKDPRSANIVADVLQRINRVCSSKTSLVFLPQRCASIEKILELNKVDLEKLNTIEELNIELFMLDTDLISMENEYVYRDIYLNDDLSSIHQIVEGLLKIEQLYGQIPRISGQGKSAKLVKDLLLKRRQIAAHSRLPLSSQVQIQHLILIDRRIDLITPLLTQLTYEGLLDEIFGVHHGTISLPAEKFVKSEEKQKDKKSEKKIVTSSDPKRKFELKSSEELFARLRDCHINGVAESLKQSAKKLQAEYDECNSEGMTIHEMGKIVKRLHHLKNAKNSQSNHVTITELINEHTLKAEFIYSLRIQHEILQEDRINRIIPDLDIKLLRQEAPLGIIRLICLQSMIANGLKSKISEYYQREIIRNYGDKYLELLIQLERGQLWLNHEKFYEFGQPSQLKSKFNLINDDVDECNPSHFSYVYGGYAPLSIVVTHILSQSSNKLQFKSWQDNLKLLPAPTVCGLDATNNDISINTIEETQNVLVFFVGGCTFAEISALRQLAQQDENSYIIGTSAIINGDSFINSLWPPSPKVQ